MKYRNFLLAILFVTCSFLFAGCGGGDLIGVEKPTSYVTGVENSTSRLTGVETTDGYGWKVELSKLVLQQPPKGPTIVDLNQVNGVYVALPTDTVVPHVQTGGGPVVTYVASNIATGKTIVFPGNIGLPARFKLTPGTYKFTAKIGDYVTEPVSLIVRCPAL